MGKYKVDNKKKEGIKFVRSNKIRTVVSEDTKRLRMLYNKLMVKDNKSKGDIVNRIIKQIDGKYSEICFKHDGCRVLQGCIKYGTTEQKKEIIAKLIPQLYNLIISKYSIYLSAKVFKYSDTKQKEAILIEVIYPNFGKLIKYASGISFIKIILANTHIAYQEKLIDYYITNYFKISIDEIKALRQHESSEEKREEKEKSSNIIIDKDIEMDNETLREKIKKHIETQLERKIHSNFIFQGMLNKIFDHLDNKTQQYISEIFNDDFIPFFDNNFGFELTCKLYTVASAKTRKKMIKVFREKLDELIKSEYGTYFLIKVMLYTDDTKMIEKNFTKFIFDKMNELFNSSDRTILKIIWNLMYPFNKKCNKPNQEAILLYSTNNSNKKDLAKRQSEVIQPLIDSIVKVTLYDVKTLLKDLQYSMFLCDLLLYLITQDNLIKVEELLNSIAETIDADCKVNKDNIGDTILTENVGQVAIKRMMKILSEAKGEVAKYERSFAEKIAKMIKGNIERFLETKAIFIIVQIVENEKTKDLLIKDIKKYSSAILEKAKNEKMAGYTLLVKHI